MNDPVGPSRQFLEANGVNEPTPPRPAFEPSQRFLEANGVYPQQDPPAPTFQPTQQFLEANGVVPEPAAPAFQPSTQFLEANGVYPISVSQEALRIHDTSAPLPAEPEPRYEALDQLIAEADDAKIERRFWFDDSRTGTTVATALAGGSDLETLTPTEQVYLAERATQHWVDTDNTEAIFEAHDVVEDDPQASRVLAEAYASTSANMEAENWRARQLFALAEHRDPTALVRSFEGQEADLAGRLQRYHLPQDQAAIMDAARSGTVSHESRAAFADAMFFHTSGGEARSHAYSGALASLMADARVDPLGPFADFERNTLATRLEGVFSSSGGQDLLFSDEIHPSLRQWAGGEVLSNAGWTAEALEGGWESQTVGTAYAEIVTSNYGLDGVRQFGAHPGEDEALRTAVGLALQMQPTELGIESEADLQAFLDGGMGQDVFGENDQIDSVVARIREIAGPDSIVTAVPVTVTSNDFGAMVETVFKVEDRQGNEILIDAQGRRTYDGVEEWITDNELPPGQMHFADGMEPGAELFSDVTPSVTDTFWEWAGKVGDYAAVGVGVVAGAALVIGTGGTAALVAAGVAGTYGAARAGAEIIDDAQHGVNVWDPTDAQNRANWLNVAAGSLSVVAIGGGLRAANLANNGARLSGAGAQALARVSFAANLADGAAMTDQTVQLAMNWQQMSPEQRAGGVLNLMFWGGMTAASTRAPGGQLENAYNYRALSDDISYAAGAMQSAHGHPNEMAVRHAASPIRLDPGDFARIADMEPGSRPDPSTYIPQDQIDAHLDMFTDGAARTTSMSSYEARGTIARPGDTFVMSRAAVDDVIANSNGDLRYIEGALGLPAGSLDGGDIGIAFIDNPQDLRLPTGNESGTNEFWEPGGLTSGYVPEAIISTPNPESVTVISLEELIRNAGH